MQSISKIGALEVGLLAGVLAACDAPRPQPAPPPPSASMAPVYVPPPAEGCARTGSLEGVEGDPTCIVSRADDVVMRESMKHLSFALEPDTQAVMSAGMTNFRLTITNGAPFEVPLLLDARPPGAGPRPDWARLAGVPEPKAGSAGAALSDSYRLGLVLRTLDSRDRCVDGLPTTAGPTAAAPVTRSLRVRLGPGAKLTQSFTWWALRIPPPGPITRDDAGHRFVPKTTPVPLPAGEYGVAVDLPLHGISPPESTFSTRIRVEAPDATP